jgi:type IV pilus assembly protein PilE
VAHFSRDSGFTLLELMISLTIGSILLALAIPGLRNLTASTRLTTQVNDLGRMLTVRPQPIPRALRRQHGVGLIEVLIAVVILAIGLLGLAGLQMHTLRDNESAFERGMNRSAAKSCLSEYAQYMERYYTTNLTYAGAAVSPGCKSDSNLSTRYTFKTTNLTQKTYTVTATPIGVQAERDTQCAVLGMNQDGTPSATGSGGQAFCW